MKLIEKEYCYIIDGVFPSSVLAGFTKTNVEGNLPYDIKRTLSFYEGNNYQISYLNQQHSNKVNFIEQQGIYQGDALFTKKSNNVLVVRTADCLPVFFYSQTEGMIGIVHMGWQGAVKGILNNISDDLSQFLAAAGAGLRRCCYQVGEEFYDYSNLSKFLERNRRGIYFDPISFVQESLFARRMNKDNFFDLNICSFCSHHNFFSYRKTATRSRILSFIIKR